MDEVQEVGEYLPQHLLILPSLHFHQRETKRSKGIAYILFQIPEDAVKAHASLDMTSFQVGGRPGIKGVGGCLPKETPSGFITLRSL